MEYREGLTRCPQHDVDLVDEPPELEEELRPSFLDRIDDRAAIRYTFIAALGAAALYAITGVAFSLLIMFQDGAAWESKVPLYLEYTQRAAWTIALAGVAAIGGAVLVRTYARLRDPGPAPGEDDGAEGGPGDGMIRLLYTLVVVFALVWAATSVATAWETAQFENSARGGFPTSFDEPSQTFLALIAVQNASWACGTAAVVVMGGTLLRRLQVRMTRGEAPRSE
jgi:hypothetical protein